MYRRKTWRLALPRGAKTWPIAVEMAISALRHIVSTCSHNADNGPWYCRIEKYRSLDGRRLRTQHSVAERRIPLFRQQQQRLAPFMQLENC